MLFMGSSDLPDQQPSLTSVPSPVAAAGALTAPLNRRGLTIEGLTTAFRSTDDPAMGQRAGELATSIAREDGVAAAVAFLERRMSRLTRCTCAQMTT